MWIDCAESLVNLARVDYINFSDEPPRAAIYFANRADPVVITADSPDELRSYFWKRCKVE